MQSLNPSFDELVEVAKRLSPLEKLALIQRLVPDLTQPLASAQDGRSTESRRSLRGLLKGCQITDQDIAQARRDMWNGFPRESL